MNVLAPEIRAAPPTPPPVSLVSPLASIVMAPVPEITPLKMVVLVVPVSAVRMMPPWVTAKALATVRLPLTLAVPEAPTLTVPEPKPVALVATNLPPVTVEPPL